MVRERLRVVIAPGNGCTDVEDKSIWYAWLRDELKKRNIPCELRAFPDPYGAHKDVWLPYLRDELKCDEHTILVGHSSGAVAALRLLQSGVRLAAVVLVSVYHTHLDDPGEMASGYFDEPWNWEEIRHNTQTILQFHSTDDPLVPVHEAREVHRLLHSSYHEYSDAGHFVIPTVRRIVYQLELTLNYLTMMNKSDAALLAGSCGSPASPPRSPRSRSQSICPDRDLDKTPTNYNSATDPLRGTSPQPARAASSSAIADPLEAV